ncbi:uncharacterized protein LOC141622088 [Silene latifolia]|uniref:uncharacterized protein LOC141622088 n=1 Tax=Silene latifolia TaxID=37657 RepID=UPI003D7849AA
MASNERSICLGGSLDRSPIGVSTRGRTRSILFRTAAARLRSASVPTRPRKSNVTVNASRESYGAGDSRPYDYPVFGASSHIRVDDPQFVSSSFREKVCDAFEKTAIHNGPSFQLFTEDGSHNSAGSSPSSLRRCDQEVLSQQSYSMVAPVMVIEGGDMEDQLNKMKTILEELHKENKEKTKQIDALTKRLERRPASSFHNEDSDDASDNDDDCDKGKSFTAKDVQKMIAEAFKRQFDGNLHSVDNHRYVKPYNKRIDCMRMPIGYQPPKFQQFDGKGNPKQHIAHFIETCNTAGSEGDLLVKQFVRSLKGIAFDWYTDLRAKSIDS